MNAGSMSGPDPSTPDDRSLRRWRRHLADEREEAAVYRNLAARRDGEEREILLGLADAEERHIAHWERLLGDQEGPRRRGNLRTRLLSAAARRFGSVFVLALAQRAEGRSPYEQDADATPAMAADEQIHEEVVRGLAARGRARVSGTFRAAVFGANDGLVSNLALVLGVSGGGAAASTVLLTGLAGLLAGRCPWRRASTSRCGRSRSCWRRRRRGPRRVRRCLTSTWTRTSSHWSTGRGG
jgi:hypothetical protein